MVAVLHEGCAGQTCMPRQGATPAATGGTGHRIAPHRLLRFAEVGGTILIKQLKFYAFWCYLTETVRDRLEF